MSKELSAARRDVVALENTEQELNAGLDDAQDELAVQERAHSVTRAKLLEAEDTIAELRAAKEAADTRVAELQQELDQAASREAVQDGTNAATQASTAKAEAERDKLQEDKNVLHVQLGRMSDMATGLSEALEVERSKLRAYQQTVAEDTQERSAAYQTKLHAALGREKELETALADAMQELSVVRGQLSDTRGSLEESEERGLLAEQRRDELQQLLLRSEDMKANLETTGSAAAARYQQAVSAMREAVATMDAAREKRIQDQAERIRSLLSQNAALQQQLSGLNTKLVARGWAYDRHVAMERLSGVVSAARARWAKNQWETWRTACRLKHFEEVKRDQIEGAWRG